jgi:AraC family transcriptional regulator
MAAPGFDVASHDHARAVPMPSLHSSSATGWTSILLHHKEGEGAFDQFETGATSDLSLAVNGTGRHEVQHFEGGRWHSATFEPGVACVIPAGETTKVRLGARSAREVFRTIHLYLPATLLAGVADDYRRIGQTVGHLQLGAFRDEVLASQVAALLAASRAGAPDLYAAGAGVWIATHLLSQHAEWRHVSDDVRLSPVITDRRLARVIEYMSAYLDQPLTLDALAREAGISTHHFGRRFRERTGYGPAAYLTMLRMERAQQLLRTTDLPVAEIGFRCGYPRPSAFSTAFLRLTGKTPTEARHAERSGRR